MQKDANAQYSVAKADSLPIRIAGASRRRMFKKFLETGAIDESDTILEVGVTSDTTYSSSNYLLQWLPYGKRNVTGVGLQDLSTVRTQFPEVRFVAADGRSLPFKDNAFSVVHSSAVLEHVGAREQQIQFVSEAVRVATRYVFITTPNKFYPVEFHTLLPFMHWLPDRVFRNMLKRMGYHFFSDINNLNLLDRRKLKNICDSIQLKRYEILSINTFGWPSNLLLAIKP